MIAPGPTLQTDRLILRPSSRDDLDGWAELMADADASRFIGGPQSRPQAWRGLMSMGGSWALEGFGMFSVLDKATGEWLGRVGPWRPEGWPGPEVGWGLRRAAWGRGYAMEAAVATIDWAFANLGWTEVIHTIEAENVPSQVLAERLGSTILRQDRLPPPFDDKVVDVWGQSRDQWRARPR